MSDPLITIGMPVYNGEDHVAASITSLLDQTFKSFELVIHDNASRDGTAAIAASLAQRDPRIRIVRHDRTISGVENFILAAEQAPTPYFCWAAHDDLHEPTFLEALLSALESHPNAGLAASGCMEMDPDGSPRRVCQATSSLVAAQGLRQCDRLVAYLHRSPCSPMYGLFRTHTLKPHLHTLRDWPGFGMDLVFLAGYLSQYDLVFIAEPLLKLRAGGASHSGDQFKSAWHLLSELWGFHRSLRQAIGRLQSPLDHVRISIARWQLFLRYLTWRPVRGMFASHLCKSMPLLGRFHDHVRSRCGAIGRLRRRTKSMPPESRIVIFGAGKHTRRCLSAMRMAVHPGGAIVGICDDAPGRVGSFGDIPIVGPRDLAALEPDLIVVSSDAYERTLYERATHIAPAGVGIWAIYDTKLEAHDRACSSASVAEMKSSIDSIASPPVGAAGGNCDEDLIASMNASRR